MNNLKVVWITVLLLVSMAARNVSNGKDFLYTANNNCTGFFSSTICFTENVGQFANKAKFRAEIDRAACYFCQDEVVYFFPLRQNELPDRNPPDMFRADIRPDRKMNSGCVKTRFIGANPDVRISGEDKLAYTCNYFLGKNPDGWHTNVANYAEIIYHEIYPGIDLRYYGIDGSLKYDLVAHPGADISQIEIQYEGIKNIAVGQDGALDIETPFGNLRENYPFMYQDTDGRRQTVKGRYVIKKPSIFGFAIESVYDPTQPLIIDPELVYSSYLGGIGWEESNGIAVGPDGSIYITGNTYSMDFPLESPYDSTLEYIEDADVFITRFTPDGGSLIYSTYLGSEDYEVSYDIAVDSVGNCYITGKTGSEGFPMVNAYDSSLAGEDDVFIAKLSAAGDSLLYSTYLGGALLEQGRAIALGNDGDIYVTGYTNSPDFPTLNAYDYSHNGGNDAFVACLTAAGGLSYCTYLGGSNPDYPYGMVIDSSGNAYIAGCTGSSDFPTDNAYNDNSNGLYDVFITTLAASGDSLIYSTYLGGSDDDYGWGIAVDRNGDIIFGGGTTSADFPTVNPINGGFNGYYDAFVAKLNASGDSIIYSTYLGGVMYDEVWGLVIDDVGNAFITGGTSSSNFPTTPGAFDEEHNGSYDVFMAQISNSGDSLLYSTYIGGYDPDYGFDICIDDEGDIYITGRSRTPDFPMVNAFDSTHNGYYDAIVMKFENIINQAYLPGDANMYNGIWPPQCIGSDVTYLVNYFRGVGNACELDDFWASADANGDCNIIGSDVTRLVNYFRGNTTLLFCVDYEPAWLTPDDLPDSAPSGWPNCETPAVVSDIQVLPTGLK